MAFPGPFVVVVQCRRALLPALDSHTQQHEPLPNPCYVTGSFRSFRTVRKEDAEEAAEKAGIDPAIRDVIMRTLIGCRSPRLRRNDDGYRYRTGGPIVLISVHLASVD